jgi:hypothetical protein
MPIGVPKVPYRLPGDEVAQWVDLVRFVLGRSVCVLLKQNQPKVLYVSYVLN